MPAYEVRWTHSVSATATVSVELDELARWAVSTLPLRELRGGVPADAHIAELTQRLVTHQHLRDALLRQWAAAHVPARDLSRGDPGREPR